MTKSTEQLSVPVPEKSGPFQGLDPSKLNFQPVNCRLCASNSYVLERHVTFLGREFRFVRCQECGLVYQNPQLTEKSLAHIYESLEYWEHRRSAGRDGTMLNYYSYLEETGCRGRNARDRVQWLGRHLSPDARVLDLGCSDGLFVNALAKAGYRASGLDISSVMTAHARETYGVDVRQADFTRDWPYDEAFDAVTCFASLSNFFDPAGVFANIRKHLKPGGYFFFNFGDGDRFLSRILGARLYLYRPTVGTIYSLKTVRRFLRDNGFSLREIFTDRQFITLPRLLGFFRIPGALGLTRKLGLQDAVLKLICPTGYQACAVYEG